MVSRLGDSWSLEETLDAVHQLFIRIVTYAL